MLLDPQSIVASAFACLPSSSENARACSTFRINEGLITAGHVTRDGYSILSVNHHPPDLQLQLVDYMPNSYHDIALFNGTPPPWLSSLPIAPSIPPPGTSLSWFFINNSFNPQEAPLTLSSSSPDSLAFWTPSSPLAEHGTSGSPLLNNQGQVVGLLSGTRNTLAEWISCIALLNFLSYLASESPPLLP